MLKILCGVDLGGTKLAVALTDEQGNVLEKLVVHDHVGKTDQEVTRYAVELIRRLLARKSAYQTNLYGIGVCFPGHTRFKEGVTITTSNLSGFKNFPLKRKIQEYFPVPVLVDNDANAQAYAEFLYGAGADVDDMIFLTISSGIGGGIILNKKLYRGMIGTAGEFGHTIIDAHDSLRCSCGNYGCLMSHASGLFFLQHARKYHEAGMATDLPLDNGAAIHGRQIKEGAEGGDPVCCRLLDEYAAYIGIGVYNVFQVFNPPMVVLGGGLMKFGGRFLEKIQQKFRDLAHDMLYEEMTIVESVLKDDAGVLGAAALLLEEHESTT